MFPKRIMIFGFPGSGKSTFAVRLSHQLKIPLYHLDKHFFVENWVEREKEDFLNIQRKLVKKTAWIIDGNALGSLEMRYSQADLVLYFCPSRLLCVGRLIKRRFFKDHFIQDRAEGCKERLPFHLLQYMWTFEHRAQHMLRKLRKVYFHTPFYKIESPQDLEKVLNFLMFPE